MHAESIFAQVTIMMVYDILKLDVFSTTGFLVQIHVLNFFLFVFYLKFRSPEGDVMAHCKRTRVLLTTLFYIIKFSFL